MNSTELIAALAALADGARNSNQNLVSLRERPSGYIVNFPSFKGEFEVDKKTLQTLLDDSWIKLSKGGDGSIVAAITHSGIQRLGVPDTIEFHDV